VKHLTGHFIDVSAIYYTVALLNVRVIIGAKRSSVAEIEQASCELLRGSTRHDLHAVDGRLCGIVPVTILLTVHYQNRSALDCDGIPNKTKPHDYSPPYTP
jgi:hypothetical protein